MQKRKRCSKNIRKGCAMIAASGQQITGVRLVLKNGKEETASQHLQTTLPTPSTTRRPADDAPASPTRLLRWRHSAAVRAAHSR